jgi:hypothetical protein
MTIFVLGMHRSGTSVATKMLELMGVYIGEQEELLPPSYDNPKGFYERKDALVTNQLIFKHHRANWFQVDNYDAPCPPLPPEITTRIQQVLSKLSQHGLWALKDPRLCFTLPEWKAMVENPTIITVSRHPGEIAQSLALRNDIPFNEGLLLWQKYIEHALLNSEGLRIIKCEYADIIDDAAAVATRIYEQLLPIFPNLHSPNVDVLKEFVDPSMKRSLHKRDISPEQLALYEHWRN